MAQIFISHAGANNAQAVALASWLKREGWGENFLDIDDGLVPGESWVRALLRESHRCEVVLLLISKAWQESRCCFAERFVAKGLEKHVIGVRVEPLGASQAPMFGRLPVGALAVGGAAGGGATTDTGCGRFLAGLGAPNGTVTGQVSDIFERLDGGTGSCLYVKESGGGTRVGWSVK